MWAKATIPDSHKEYAAQIALLPTENDPIAHADACETLVIKPYRRRPVDLIFVKLVTGKRGWGDVSNLGLTSGEMQEIMAASLKVTATNLGVADKDTVAGKVKAAVAAMKSK